MKMIKNIGILIFAILALPAMAHINPKQHNKPVSTTVNNTNLEVNFREDCQAPEEQEDLNINNVRARLLTGGDLWWDLDEGKYIVPNVEIGSGIPEVSSLFAGGVWLGGLDPNDNLKLAASAYRGNGRQDFYTGPLDPMTGLTDLPICNDWDDFFIVNGSDIQVAISSYNQSVIEMIPFPCDSVRVGLLDWPAKGNPNFPGPNYDFELPDTGQGLASFWDQDGDGDYDPCAGDFPIIDIRGCEPATRDEAEELVPDQMIFWIYNDAGGPHSYTQGAALNMEVQVQAFAYATNDEINDMTFYRYKLINRGMQDLRNTYFAMWVDPDLGCATDDFVGCDVERGLAYTYNEDLLDGSSGCDCGAVNTYCDQVPIIGTDYFRGPLAPRVIVGVGEGQQHVVAIADDYNKAVYNVGDTINIRPVAIGEDITPTFFEELGMSSFIYYNNASTGPNPPQTTDPGVAQQYYNYLEGLWLDRTPITQGGSGFNPGSSDSVKYTFPGNPSSANDWSMCSADLGFGDRRTIQASGPFLLKPSATNELIIGAVWVPDMDYPCPDIRRLQRADDLAQALFDACFDIIDGPDAPDMCSIELDREVILVMSNDSILSNNAFEAYEEVDIIAPDNIEDEAKTYRFEGYRVFQLANSSVSAQELDDIEKSRIVSEVDVVNGISTIYNWNSMLDPNPASNELIWTPELKVEGLDEGISNTIRVTDDLFASGNDTKLVNHKKYYYMVLAYAYNNYAQFEPKTGIGQRTGYLEGRQNIKVLTVIPRPIVYTNQNAEYGDGGIITRLQGEGVGSNFIDVDPSMYEKMFEGTTNGEIVYKEGEGPVSISIYNPLEVKDGNFVLEIHGEQQGGVLCGFKPGATWSLTNTDNGDVFTSNNSIDILNEQLIAEYGFSIAIAQGLEPGNGRAKNNGALGIEVEYEDPSGAQWYGAVRDDARGFDPEQVPPFLAPFFNFMKTGNGEVDFNKDPERDFGTVGDAIFYPFVLTSALSDPEQPFLTPAWKQGERHGFLLQSNGLSNLNNVDIIFTNDKSKWSRCIVIESATEDFQQAAPTEGGVEMFNLRASASIDKDGNPDGDGDGMSWFPGYAVDVETGKRLNIFFGENSTFDEDFAAAELDDGVAIGRDMMYNPSSQIFTRAAQMGNGSGMLDLVMGGHHYVYVTRDKYDGCEGLRNELSKPLLANFTNIINALKSITWTSMTLLRGGTEFLHYADGAVPNNAIIKLRADNPYRYEKDFSIAAPTACETFDGNPKYNFEIRGKAAVELSQEEYAGALDNVNAVPNPYYGYSAYETSQFTTTVKLTNLPPRCDVTIYSIDGKFIRQFRRDERTSRKPGSNPAVLSTQELPDIEWDLKNFSGIPVASGAYLIHISAPDYQEEKTIKWFGVNRQFDPSGL